MSFLNLGRRFQPAKKAWNIFTSKLHFKLHKLNRSKAIKKPKTRLKTTSKPLYWPSITFKPRLQKRRRIYITPALHHNRLQRRSKPVYIDQLFIEPAVSAALENHPQPPPTAATTKKCSSSSETPKEESCEADDMWESLGMASPGINERAEEFITRIRAEMQLQEMMARRS